MSDLGNNGAAAPRQVQLTVSSVQNDLSNGLSRPMIQAKYNLSGKDLKALFSHPKLKGLKTKVAPSFVLIDDTDDSIATETANVLVEEPAVEEVVAEIEFEEVAESLPQTNATNEFEPWESDLSTSDSLI
jgi:hypothetical protein